MMHERHEGNIGVGRPYFEHEMLKPLDMHVYYSVARDGMELEFAPLELRNNKEIVLRAVTQNGMALQFASDSLHQDLDIVRAAVKQNSLAFEYVPKSMRSFLVLQVSLKITRSGYFLYLSNHPDVSSRENNDDGRCHDSGSWPLLLREEMNFSEITW